MQAIETLRGLLGEYAGGGDGLNTTIGARSSETPPPPRQHRVGVTEAAAGTGQGGTGAHGDGHGSDETSRQSPAAVAAPPLDGELARVARGRLEWLTWRLRGHLSLELASALRRADPLAAGGGSETQGRRGQGAGSGAGPSDVDGERRREGVVLVKVREGRTQQERERLILF